MNPSQRMEWLDRAKAIGIFLVVIGHISGIPTLSVNFIYAFHMPLFFFLSGYLYKNNRKSIIKRFVILLFSYAIASFIYTISWNLFVNKNNIDWAAEIQRIIYCCYSDGNPCSVLWFIQCLAVVTLLYGIIDSVLGKYGNARFFIITTSFWLIGYYFEINNITLPFRIQTAAVALPFYCIGNYCRKNQTIYKIKENKSIEISLLVIAFSGYITSVLMNGRVDMESGVYNYYILFVIGAICGIGLVLFAANAMNPGGLCIIGRHTLIIYLVHVYGVMMFKRIFANFVSQTVVIKLLSYVCTYGLLCLIIGFSEFIKYKKFGQTENNMQSKSLFMEDKNYVSF